ncbi:S1/P1 Nuclease [Pustulibacterium marinum]|uniref:S1/P1 Nuclease n=1 Tax=Pustulibacterium marinum TaxID=1224947 RepID=A0A1I7FCI7_9FLAO|nr:S1/P1 nuclease [Pustulibacterium marinum]SFU33825.1 S1/P1 Nuclease [Pustulibacterium marinum]
MKKIAFILTLLITSISFAGNENPFFWGPTGHRVVGEVASKYIKKSTARKIEKLLDGHSIAEVATHADDIKSDKRFKGFGPWHYVNMELGKSYGDDPVSEKGDLVKAIDTCMTVLKSDTSSREDKQFYLKLLIHFVGDLHQPMHVGRSEDLGGNKIKVTWFGDKSNLHRVWDSDMINGYEMSYTEIADNYPKLTRRQVKFLQKGSVLDWVADTQKLVEEVYASAEDGDKLSYLYMYENFPKVKVQLEKGGVRLAKMLDEAF